MRCKFFTLLFLSLSTLACDLIYPQKPQAAPPDVESKAAVINPRVARPMSPRPVVGGVCQDNAAIRLLASGQYEPAHVLLEKEVKKGSRQQTQSAQQYCTYLGLNLLHLLSASPYFNLAKAVEYQNRLQALIDEGVSDEQGLLLSKALNEVMLQHTANSRLQTSIAALRTELEQKEEAIQRLKELTMESGS